MPREYPSIDRERLLHSVVPFVRYANEKSRSSYDDEDELRNELFGTFEHSIVRSVLVDRGQRNRPANTRRDDLRKQTVPHRGVPEVFVGETNGPEQK